MGRGAHRVRAEQVVVQARKPDFWAHAMPLYEVVTPDGLMRPAMNASRGGLYCGGSATMVRPGLGQGLGQGLRVRLPCCEGVAALGGPRPATTVCVATHPESVQLPGPDPSWQACRFEAVVLYLTCKGWPGVNWQGGLRGAHDQRLLLHCLVSVRCEAWCAFWRPGGGGAGRGRRRHSVRGRPQCAPRTAGPAHVCTRACLAISTTRGALPLRYCVTAAMRILLKGLLTNSQFLNSLQGGQDAARFHSLRAV